ncbi:MAG: cation transporter [Spirochaetia bacterium]|nr:cation transporter [Spirochaetia bacterium]
MGKDHTPVHEDQSNLRMAFFINLGFTVLEIIGGLWTNSMAILSDAIHDLGDSISLGLAWFLDRYSQKGPDKKFSFGYARFSLLGALVNSLVLVGGSTLVLAKAIPRLLSPEAVNPQGMLVFAVLGIVANGIAVLRLQKGSSLNEKVVSWHLMEDVLGWVAVLIVSIVLLFADLPILDPILSVAITIYILFNVGKNLKEILNVLLQGVPKNISIDEMEQAMQKADGLLSVHHTHIWSLEGEKNLLSTHVLVRDDTGRKALVALKANIRSLLKEKGIDHVTIEIEFESEECTTRDCE